MGNETLYGLVWGLNFEIMKKKIFLAIIFICNYSQSQYSEIFFKQKYSKIGLEVGTQNMYVRNSANSANFQWTNSSAVNVGLSYNFYQKKNYNFKVGILFSFFDINEKFIVFDNSGGSIIYQGSTGPYSLFLIPLESEYFIKITEKIYFSITPGIEVAFNHYGSDEGKSISGGGIAGNITKIESNEFSRDFPIYFGANFGAAISLETKPMLLKFNVKYHKQFEDFIYRANSTINVNGNNSNASQNLTGDYLGFGISIFPNKNFF